MEIGNIKIRKAEAGELDSVQQFYYMVIDQLEGLEYGPKWVKKIYPAREDFRSAIEEKTLYLCENESGNILAAMVLNNKCDEEYAEIDWKVKAGPEDVLLIHLLCVDQNLRYSGIGSKMVSYALETARQTGMKAVRLDVISGNLPAENLYVKHGFRFITEMTLYFEDTGWAGFRIFEYEV